MMMMMRMHHRGGVAANLLLHLTVLFSSSSPYSSSTLHHFASPAFRLSTVSMESAGVGKTLEKPQPPAAKKVEHVMKLFGDVRVDNYYWLRDDSRSNPEVLSYLEHENAYTDSIMSGNTSISLTLYFSVWDQTHKPNK